MAFAQFDEWFTEASLRIDYTLTGNDKNTAFALKEMIREPYWSGSTVNLIDKLEYGNYIVKVYEPGTDHLLFSKGYQNLYGEWQTTAEASKVTKTFDESVIVPFPKKQVEVVLYRKDWEGRLLEGMRLTVKPDDYFIRTADKLNLPVYEAWIANNNNKQRFIEQTPFRSKLSVSRLSKDPCNNRHPWSCPDAAGGRWP